MELYDVVRKLIGPIAPVGEEHTDAGRLENLKAQIELMERLHMEVDRIAEQNKDRQEFSLARAGKLCNEYLDMLGILG